ncbi:MAG: ATP-binding protein [Thermodesulfovibrionales bacterium]|nr:ATP-binding protein [Thermodesulfovibrionales bacterium]
MEDLSLHILDIVENSIAAGANRIEIRVVEDTRKDILSVEIRDNGKGMSEKVLENAVDPFYTSRTTRRVGLGLSLLSQSAKEAEGDMTIKSKEDEGTTIYAYFKHSHIDRKPIGNMAETLIVLIAGNPAVDFLYEHRLNNRAYSIDTKDIREELGDVPLSSPDVIEAIRKDIRNGLKILSS